MSEIKNKSYGFLAYDFIGVEKELNEMAAAGWQKVADWNQMQIFASLNPDATPIDTDAEVLLDITTRSVCKRQLPIHFALLAFFAFALFFRLVHIPPATADSVIRANFWIELIPDVVCIFFALSYILNFLLWRRRSQKSIEVNGTCADCNLHYIIQAVESIILIAFAILFVVLKCNINGWGTLEMSFYPFVAGFFFLFMFYLSKFFRFIGASKIVNMVLTFIGSVFLSLLFASICSAIFMVFGILIKP